MPEPLPLSGEGVAVTPEPVPPSPASVTVTSAGCQPAGTSSPVVGAAASARATPGVLGSSTLPPLSTEADRSAWPLARTGLCAESYVVRVADVRGSVPSVVYHVAATPEPVPSLAVSVTGTPLATKPAGTSSRVVGAVTSTFAGAEVWTPSAFFTAST